MNIINNNIEAIELFKRIKTLPLILPEYVKDIFDLISANNQVEELYSFLVYYKKTFINKFEIEFWNLFNEFNLLTNNPCDSYNNRLKSFFEKKLTFLIYYIFLEEKNLYQ